MEQITLKTLPNKTKQEVFDFVAYHLLTQNRKSIIKPEADELEKCAYRGKNGMKCAVGCLISDEEYDPNMEFNVWESIARTSKIFAHLELLKSLQRIHDNEQPSEWYNRLERFAYYESLNFNFKK